MMFILMTVCLHWLGRSSAVGHVSCEEASTTFQCHPVCSSSNTLSVREKNAHPNSADTCHETGASENVEVVEERCRH